MTSQEFYNLFNVNEKEYLKKYIWNDDSQTIGFAIIKNYPKGKSFKPAIKKDGSDDTVAMIKVYTFPKEDSRESWVVGATVAKVSLYKIDNPMRFPSEEKPEDIDAPIEESLKKSVDSPQPIDLEEPNRFTFNFKSQTFFDKKKNITIAPKFIIDYMYKEHIDTYASTRGYILKFKFNINILLIKFIESFSKFLIKTIQIISGRKVENEAYDFLLKPFYFPPVNPRGVKDQIDSNNKLEEYDNLLKKINPFTFSFITSFILILYILYYKFCINFLGLISFVKANKDDQIFSVSIIAFTILFFNYMLPNILLYTLNSCVHLYKKLSSKRFKL